MSLIFAPLVFVVGAFLGALSASEGVHKSLEAFLQRKKILLAPITALAAIAKWFLETVDFGALVITVVGGALVLACGMAVLVGDPEGWVVMKLGAYLLAFGVGFWPVYLNYESWRGVLSR